MFSRQRTRARGGAILVLFAAGLLTLVGFMALAVDVGYLYVLKARIQGVVDAAVLGAARVVNPKADLSTQQLVLKGIARRLLSINGLDAQHYNIQVSAPVAASARPTAWRVILVGQEHTAGFFAAALGHTGFKVGIMAEAVAVPTNAGVAVGLVE
jgi:Flp pilus assembly protein TadG